MTLTARINFAAARAAALLSAAVFAVAAWLVFLSVGPALERAAFPVIRDFTVVRSGPINARAFWMVGRFYKLRPCVVQGVGIFARDTADDDWHVLDVRIIGQTPIRPLGWNQTRRWEISAPPDEPALAALEVRGMLYYNCGWPWLTLADIGRLSPPP